MPAEALSCPQCGAPLALSAQPQLTICIYCNATVRVSHPAGGAVPAADVVATAKEPTPEALAEIKQLLVNGQRAEALARYQALTGLAEAEANTALQSLVNQVSIAIIRNQELNAWGWLYVALAVFALGFSIVAGAMQWLSGPWAWLIVIGANLWLAFWLRPVFNTLQMLGAVRAPATVLKIAPIGVWNKVHFFRVLLEVTPAQAPPFQAQLNLPVRAQSVHKLHPHTQLEVRYLPNNVERMVFNRILHY